MYGLKQAGIIANVELTKYLEKFGYHPVRHTPGLWKHNTQATIFSLVVDNFSIKYASKQDADHLLQALCAKYTISTDWDAYWTGTIPLDMLNYLCQNMSPEHYTSLNKLSKNFIPTVSISQNIFHTSTLNQNMVRRFNTQNPPMIHLP